MELNVTRDVEKDFYRHISSKRNAKKNVDPLLNRADPFVTKDMEKAEELHVLLVSPFIGMTP